MAWGMDPGGLNTDFRVWACVDMAIRVQLPCCCISLTTKKLCLQAGSRVYDTTAAQGRLRNTADRRPEGRPSWEGFEDRDWPWISGRGAGCFRLVSGPPKKRHGICRRMLIWKSSEEKNNCQRPTCVGVMLVHPECADFALLSRNLKSL